MKQAVKKNQHILLSILSLFIFFFLWELIVDVFDISKTVLIKPTVIFTSILSNYDIILPELLYSIWEILPGWIIGNAVGFLVAIFIYRKEKLSNFLTSWSVVINAVPLIALSAILGGIMGTDRDQKILLISLILFFPMFITTLSQLKVIDQNLKDLLISYSATPKQILFKLLIPKSLPFILNVLKVNAITAIFTGITAEFFGGYGGIGIFILSKKGLFNLELVWASIFCIAIFGSIFYFSLDLIQKKVLPWYRS